mmetsp:Transcript_52312/g.130259  ORF Transcript_52312/g.130259 Transcript_52312/m.130259 type:complete len:190 (-) Transcript_52312:40-609(-)
MWIDYMCIPQRDPSTQLAAIQSLPYYVHASARFTALVMGAEGKEEYLQRAWCQAELIASKLPLRMPAWEPQWLHTRGMFRDISPDSKAGRQGRLEPILLGHIRDITSCKLTDQRDMAKLRPLLEFAAKELTEMTEWDDSPDRAKTRAFGSGRNAMDEDPLCRKQGVTRKEVQRLIDALRSSLGGGEGAQ